MNDIKKAIRYVPDGHTDFYNDMTEKEDNV